jgi:putative membrane protein
LTPKTIFDVGAQLERTALAWLRTALALTAAGALLARLATHAGVPALAYAVGAWLIATGVVAGVSTTRSYGRRHAALHAGARVTAPIPLHVISAAVAVAAASAMAGTLLHH